MTKRKRRKAPRVPSKPRHVPNGSDLCLQCGMCCDGTLFLNASVMPGERELVESLGFSTRDAPARDMFALPCSAFLEGCCSLYSVERPHICSAYRCRPLEELEADRMTLEEGEEIIRLMRALARTLEDEMGMKPGSFTRVALSAFIERHQPRRDPERYATFLATYDRLLYLGLRYFHYEIQSADDVPTEVVPA